MSPPLPTQCSSPPLPRLLHSSPPPSSIAYFLILSEQFSAFMCAMYFPSCRYRVVTPLCYEDCYSTYTVLRLRACVFITPHKHTPVTQVLALCLSVSLSLSLSLSTSHIRSLTLDHTMAHQQESRESEICCLSGLRPHTLIA